VTLLSKVKIGLEIHMQLNTKSKLFCACKTKSKSPNTATCEVCLGMPGSKPVLNKKALDFAVMLSLALNCNVSKESRFDRKTYFYPDLPKNYQITQYHSPISENGKVLVQDKIIRIRRVQLEEDPGSITYPHHIDISKYSLIDYNRSGMPLCEIVTDPDFSSSKEIKLFLKQIISIAKHLKIYTSDKSFRVDTNVSIGRNSRVEIKNVGSIKDVVSAIESEVFRQRQEIENGQKIKQETRRFSGSSTVRMREKETEEDYGYIVDPDLPTLFINATQLRKIQKSMPELPDQRMQRMMKQYKLNKSQALAIVSEKELADFYERVAKDTDPQIAASWISTQLLKVLNYNNLNFSETHLEAQHFAPFLNLITAGKIGDRAADLLLRALVLKPQNPSKLAAKLKLLTLTDSELVTLIKSVLNKYKKQTNQYKLGDSKILAFLMGRVINASKGRADAKKVRQEIVKYLA
jgi:aspartyl-tRNA(Asn)/glutamyl-tRNA(Gln) amidotransferase subunit B